MKLPINIYRVNREFEDLELLDFNDIGEKIKTRIENGGVKLKKKDILTTINIPTNIVNNIFFYRFLKIKGNKWEKYLTGIYGKLNDYYSSDMFDFVLLIESKNKNIYAILGGNSSIKISSFLDDYFGLDILSRLINPNDERVKAVFEKKITGPIFAQQKNYRTSTSIEEEDFDFGKIFKEITAAIDKTEIAEKFGIDTGIIIRKQISFLGKNSLKLGCSIEEKELFGYLGKVDDLLDDSIHPPRFYINEMDSIGKNKKELIGDLDLELSEILFKNFKILELKNDIKSLKLLFPSEKDFNLIDYEINHTNLPDYLSAESFIFDYDKNEIHIDDFSLNNINELFTHIINNGRIKINSSMDMDNLLKGILNSIGSDDKILTEGKLKSHITGEVVLKNKSYFIIEGNWFIIRDNYIDKLKHRFENIVRGNLLDGSLLSINAIKGEDEGVFNRKFCGKDGFLVFDTFTPDGIELADLILFYENNVYIFHVKKGFGGSMRDLANQIELSSKRLNAALNGQIINEKKEDYLTRLFKNAKNSKKHDIKNQFSSMDKEDFLSKFRGKKINYVMTIITDNESVESFTDSHSNIGKFSLINAYQSVILKGYGFYVKLVKEI